MPVVPLAIKELTHAWAILLIFFFALIASLIVIAFYLLPTLGLLSSSLDSLLKIVSY